MFEVIQLVTFPPSSVMGVPLTGLHGATPVTSLTVRLAAASTEKRGVFIAESLNENVAAPAAGVPVFFSVSYMVAQVLISACACAVGTL